MSDVQVTCPLTTFLLLLQRHHLWTRRYSRNAGSK